MPPTDQSERDKDFLASVLKPEKNPWPGVIMFVAFLAFIFKMTELFVR